MKLTDGSGKIHKLVQQGQTKMGVKLHRLTHLVGNVSDELIDDLVNGINWANTQKLGDIVMFNFERNLEDCKKSQSSESNLENDESGRYEFGFFKIMYNNQTYYLGYKKKLDGKINEDNGICYISMTEHEYSEFVGLTYKMQDRLSFKQSKFKEKVFLFIRFNSFKRRKKTYRSLTDLRVELDKNFHAIKSVGVDEFGDINLMSEQEAQQAHKEITEVERIFNEIEGKSKIDEGNGFDEGFIEVSDILLSEEVNIFQDHPGLDIFEIGDLDIKPSDKIDSMHELGGIIEIGEAIVEGGKTQSAENLGNGLSQSGNVIRPDIWNR